MVRVLFAKNTIYTDEVEMLFEGKSAEDVIKAIDERQAKHRTYRYDYEPKREAQEAKIISAGEFVESENAKDKAAKTDESTAKEPETAVKIKPSAEEKPAENKPATAKKPRKTSAKKVDKPEGGDGKLE